MPDTFFVYGTLKRGEERSQLWPRSPQWIEEATIRGRLFDLGPYPALAEGDLIVCGELWHFDEADVPVTLSTLDQIEGHANEASDLYVRQVVESQARDGRLHSAYTYFFANPHRLSASLLVPADAEGRQIWNAREPGQQI